MEGKMRFAVIAGEKKAEVHEHEIPEIGPDEILIENHTCNLCTTDYQQWMGLRPHQPTPVAFGHESSGIIAEMGEAVKGFELGEQVVVNNYMPCMECSSCRKGMNSAYCEFGLGSYTDPDKYGYYGIYGCGEYQIFKSKHVLKVSSDLPFEHAGFCEPLATVIRGKKRLRIKTGENVLVIGVGTMGMLNAQVARYYGANVIISEISEKKINTAKKLGFEKLVNVAKEDLKEKIDFYTKGQGLDAIAIAVGNTKAYNQALEVASKGCRMLIFAGGYPEPTWDLEPNPVHYQLWEIIGTYGCSTGDYQLATELMSKNKIDVAPLIEDEYPLDDIQEAFARASEPDMYRVAVRIQD